MYTYHNYNKYFFLTDTINDDIERKALKFVNLNIIYYNEKETEKKEIDIIKYNKIYNFCKKNKIPIYITNNFKLLLKLKADGIFITSENICTRYPKIKNKILEQKIKLIEATKKEIINNAKIQVERISSGQVEVSKEQLVELQKDMLNILIL